MSAEAQRMLRPSGAHRWLKCAASPSREAVLPDPPSKDASYGTAAHAIAERCLVGKSRAEAFLGDLVDTDTGPVRVDMEMVEGVQRYLDYISTLTGEPHQLEAERKVALAPWLPNDGTTDCVVLTIDALHIVDLKFGRGVKVYPERNPQLMTYALGIYADLEDLGLVDPSLRVVLHIAQPRLDHFDQWDTSAEELFAFGTTLQTAARVALEPDPPAVPGKHCKFCRARSGCAELARYTADQVGLQFDDLTQAPVATPAPPAPVADLPADRLVSMLSVVDVVRDWANAVEAAALSAALSGVELPGYKVVAGRTTRAWADGDSVIAHAKKKRLSIDEFYPRDLASPAQLEKSLGKEKFSKLGFPLLLDRKEGKPTLAPAGDKRPALTVQPVAEKFDDLTTTEVDPLS